MGRHAGALAFVALLALVFIAHGSGVRQDFWFDDHTHLELCREHGFTDLANCNRFDWKEKIAHVWWARAEVKWSYFRPLIVVIRVTLLKTFGLNPLPFHIVHLALFATTAALFFGLLRRLGCGPAAALLGSALFVLHPANAITGSYLGNDGTVLVGLFSLLGLRLMQASAEQGHKSLMCWLGLVACCWCAMLSRENGVMLPFLMIVLDQVCRALPCSHHHHRQGIPAGTVGSRLNGWRRLLLYGVLLGQIAAYLVLRGWLLEAAPLPRAPYFHWPHEAEFWTWAPFKLLNDMVCLPWGLPLVSIGNVYWWQARPIMTLLGLVIVAATIMIVVWPLRRNRVLWGLLMGTALALAPTFLLFSAGYNYFMGTLGWAAVMVLWAHSRWHEQPRLVSGVLGVMAVLYAVNFWAGAWQVHSAMSCERLVRADVLATQPERYPHGTRLFFINLPFWGSELGPAVRLAAERPDLEFYHWTIAPDLFTPRNEILIQQEDDHTLLIRTQAPGWFSGEFGERLLLGWFGASRRDLPIGPVKLQPAAGPLPFTVEVVAADSSGVQALRIRMTQSLGDPRVRVFVSGNTGGTELVTFPLRQVITFDKATRNVPASADVRNLRRMQSAYDRVMATLLKLP